MCRKLMTYEFAGDQMDAESMHLDEVEACQIINLNPGDTDELISYIPTMKRFGRYFLSNFIGGE